jgi:hypothetical protein
LISLKKEELKRLAELIALSEELLTEISLLDERKQELIFNNLRHTIADEIEVLINQLAIRSQFVH